MSKNISEEIEKYQKELELLDNWIRKNWGKVPDYVQNMIVRGRIETIEIIEKLKEVVKK